MQGLIMMYSPTVTFKNMMFTRLALLLLTTLLAASIHRATALNYCPPVWTQYQLPTGSFCYRLFGIRRTWQEAETTCQKYTICQGKETAHLVSVGSAEEEGFLNSYWKEMRGSFEGNVGFHGFCLSFIYFSSLPFFFFSFFFFFLGGGGG